MSFKHAESVDLCITNGFLVITIAVVEFCKLQLNTIIKSFEIGLAYRDKKPRKRLSSVFEGHSVKTVSH